MQLPKSFTGLALSLLLLSGSIWAQEKAEREVEIHKNVKLLEMNVPQDLPEDITKQYRAFLTIFEVSLKETTKPQEDECSLTVRVAAGVKEVGSAKTKRPLARVTAYRRNSKQEYLGTLILYSYVTASPVNKEEVSQFLKKQILDPAECKASS